MYQKAVMCQGKLRIELIVSNSFEFCLYRESVVLSVEIRNESSKNIARVETTLLEIATYTAKRGKPLLNHFGVGHRHQEIEKKVETRTVVQYIEVERKHNKFYNDHFRRISKFHGVQRLLTCGCK